MTLSLPPEIRRYLKAQIATEERYRGYPYTDTQGHLTIGYGRNLDANPLSQDESLYLLDNDMSRTEQEIWKVLPWYAALSDVRKLVIFDMAFNLGVEGVCKFNGMIGCIKEQDFRGAAEHMRHSLWETQVGRRADRLADMMESGELP